MGWLNVQILSTDGLYQKVVDFNSDCLFSIVIPL